MKKLFSFFLTLILIFSIGINTYAYTTNYTVPITITSVTKNNEGVVQNTFKQGEDVNIEYTITPQDIPSLDTSNDCTVDIVLVLDTSGSMNDPGMTFSEWINQNTEASCDNYYYYNGTWHSLNSLYRYYVNKVETRLDNAKTAMKSFVEKLSTVENAVYINVAIVSFDYYANDLMDFKNVKTDKKQILKIIDKIKAEGSTNGGDGLRVAYNKLSINRPLDAKKYIVYLADGENNILTYSKDKNTSSEKYVYVSNFGKHNSNKETIITDKYYEHDLGDFEFDSYVYTNNGIMAKYINRVDGNVIYHNSVHHTLERFKYSHSCDSDKNDQNVSYYMGADLYVDVNDIYITSQFKNNGSIEDLTPMGYATTVANELIANENITTYVIGVGDEVNTMQKEQNQTICKTANSTNFISDFYFPVNDTNLLEKIYIDIGEEILQSVPVKDIQLQIKFPKAIQIKSEDSDVLSIENLNIDGKEDDDYLINGSALLVKIDDFEYVLDEENNVYKANPIVLTIKVHIPENYEVGNIVLDNSKLLYNALGINVKADVAVTSFSIVENMKPVSVSSTLEINKDGSAKLKIVPSENCDKIYIKTQDETEDFVFELVDLEKDKQYIINISKEQIQQFENDIIYVETIKNIEDKAVEGIEEISVISFNQLVNEKINYTSDTTRLSVLEINGQQNLREFNVIVNGNNVDNIAPIYACGVHKKEITVQNGTNDIIVSVKNAYDNSTILHLDVEAKVVRPSFEYKIVDKDSVQVKIDDLSNQIKSIIINLLDENGNIIKKYEETNITKNKKDFIAKFDSIDVDNYNIDIDIVDIFNNGIKTGNKYCCIIESGMYVKGKDNFYDKIPNIVCGYRYQFAIKFYITQDAQLIIKTDDGVSIDIKNCVLYAYEEKTPLTYLSKQFKMEQDDTKAIYKIDVNDEGETDKLVPGKEYLLVFDIKFFAEKDLNNANFSMILGSNISQQIINLEPEPLVE